MHALTILRSALPPVSLQYRPPAIAAGGQDVIMLLGDEDGAACCPSQFALFQGQVEDPFIGLLDALWMLRGEDDEIGFNERGDASLHQECMHLNLWHI